MNIWCLQLVKVTQSILNTEFILKQTGCDVLNRNIQQIRQNTERGTQRVREQEWAVDSRILSWSPHSLCRWCSDVFPGHIALPWGQSREVEPYWISCHQDVLSSLCLSGSESCSLRNTSSVLCIVPVGKTHTLELEGPWKVRCQSIHSTPGLKEIHLIDNSGINSRFDIGHVTSRENKKHTVRYVDSLKPDNDNLEGDGFFFSQATNWRIFLTAGKYVK